MRERHCNHKFVKFGAGKLDGFFSTRAPPRQIMQQYQMTQMQQTQMQIRAQSVLVVQWSFFGKGAPWLILGVINREDEELPSFEGL